MELPPGKIWKADVSSGSPSSKRIEELWAVVGSVLVWKSFAISGNMVT